MQVIPAETVIFQNFFLQSFRPHVAQNMCVWLYSTSYYGDNTKQAEIDQFITHYDF